MQNTTTTITKQKKKFYDVAYCYRNKATTQQSGFPTFLCVFDTDSYGYFCSLSLVTCGSRPSATRIVGGTAAPVNSWPWQVMLRDEYGNQFCGGSLVDTFWAVTAAHCLDGRTPSGVRIR